MNANQMFYLNYNLLLMYFYYRFHSKAPWFHSWYRPAIKIIIKIREEAVQFLKLLIFIILIIGNIKAISTSKIKKIIAIKKNRIEKGSREELKGSKPHSNGEFFSRSRKFFFDKNEAKNITIVEISIIININIKIMFIIYIINNKLYDWKSYILFILYKFLITSSINTYV